MTTVPVSQRDWHAYDVVVILIASILVLPSLAVGLQPILARFPGLTTQTQEALARLLAIAFQEAGLIFLTLGSLRFGYRRSYRAIGLVSDRFLLDVIIGIAAVAPLYLLKVSSGQLGTALFKLFIPAKQVAAMLASENDVIGVLFKTGPAYLDWLFGIMLVVVAPLAEEIFFRGFTCEVMRERLGSRGAIIASALLFAAVHLYLVQFIPVFVMGLGLAWLYETRRSLVPSYLAHVTLNLIAVLLLLLGNG